MLKKDLLELCLLQLLSRGDKYGYEVLAPLRSAFPDTQESAIYALLRGLGKSGLTSWYMAPGGGGPDRKYYQITPAGRERLDVLQADWRNMRDAIASFGVG
ncbi:MAG: PadR family transcriptional regulator [Lawsonibacter sp.]|nr:PadR family transcriptional regulator [Lawsonibacter sp.]